MKLLLRLGELDDLPLDARVVAKADIIVRTPSLRKTRAANSASFEAEAKYID